MDERREVAACREIQDDLDKLLDVLPPDIREAAAALAAQQNLTEIVMDLGRPPEARTGESFQELLDRAVTHEDLEYVISRVGAFGPDNRAGIPQTLHRISCIRNRQGQVVGLTCRVGRAVFGTIDILRDVVESGASLLLVGRPGVGKTTMLREIARVLADEFQRRVIVVDTSNEIAGDGDIPHPGIGRARRMQVPLGRTQAQVMIEAVENHMPQVVVIDEIGTEAEAQAARTIAERGVQLIATAHGNTLENLVLNPTLADLVGGVQAVTLGDEEARKRGTQKTVLERKAPPTFDVLVEIHSQDRVAIHHDVARTVDLLLRGIAPRPEIRVRDGVTGQVKLVQESNLDQLLDEEEALDGTSPKEESRQPPFLSRTQPRAQAWGEWEGPGAGILVPSSRLPSSRPVSPGQRGGRTPLRIYPHGVSRGRLERLLEQLAISAQITEHLQEADLVLTVKGQYRKMPKKLKEAERRGLPVHVLRSNTVGQMERFLLELASENGHAH